MATAFEWDDAKAVSNVAKHQVDFIHATVVWADPNLLVLEVDARPEPRWMAIGIAGGRILSVVFTHPDAETIRLISARPASRKERASYAGQ